MQFDLVTEWNGNCRVSEPIAAGEYVEIAILVENAPHFDWGPVKEIILSFPLESFMEVQEQLSDQGHHEKRFEEGEVAGPNLEIDGRIRLRFVMPDCLQLMLRFQVGFWNASVLRSATDQDHATVSYRTRQPRKISVLIPGAPGFQSVQATPASDIRHSGHRSDSVA